MVVNKLKEHMTSSYLLSRGRSKKFPLALSSEQSALVEHTHISVDFSISFCFSFLVEVWDFVTGVTAISATSPRNPDQTIPVTDVTLERSLGCFLNLGEQGRDGEGESAGNGRLCVAATLAK